jgi:hypothetical protein
LSDRYHGQLAFLKAARGLHYLALLLRNPGREYHVSELVGQVIGRPLVLDRVGHAADLYRFLTKDINIHIVSRAAFFAAACFYGTLAFSAA